MHGRFSNLFRQKVLAPTCQHAKGPFPYQGRKNLASLYSVARPGKGSGTRKRHLWWRSLP
ncbi:hypothetical protein PDR5_14740 [Pseudomonas sp. DR 5-09]|nr:hypothetical protein PDR5_14740 [Pseudomonas sp. DR 5-09]